MSEEPLMRVGQYEARRENTSLFTFVGKTAIDGVEFDNCQANHLFIQEELDEGTGAVSGVYYFLDNETAEMALEIGAYMIENGYTCHINGQKVPNCDMDAYNNHIEQKVARLMFTMDDELSKLFGDGSTT